MDFRRSNIDLVGKLKLWFGISLVLTVVGLLSLAFNGINRGIDFRGGGQFQYRIPKELRPSAAQEAQMVADTRALLEEKGIRGAKPQIAGGDTLVINTQASDQSELNSQQRRVIEALEPKFKGLSQGFLGQQFVGPVIGKELTNNAIKGVVIGVLLIAFWIYLRYNFAGAGTRYAVAGIVALVHDVVMLLGIFSILGAIDSRIEVDGAFIAALLTVVGYSINDSVVIFDRIRENLNARHREPFERVVNDSLLETMSRSINTGLAVLIMLFVMLFFGGESIYNFVLAMLIGIASGLYSSIFNASMVLVAWNRWDEKRAAQRGDALPARAAASVSTRNATTRATSATRVATAPRTDLARTDIPPRRSTFATAPSATVSGATISDADVNDTVSTDSATPYATQPLEETAASGEPLTTAERLEAEAAQAPDAIPVGAPAQDSVAEDFAVNGGNPASQTAEEAARQRANRKARAKRRF